MQDTVTIAAQRGTQWDWGGGSQRRLDHKVTEGEQKHALSSSISSSNSTSSPGCRPSRRMISRASFGRLKLVLRLELRLVCPPGVDDLPTLEIDVRREGGPEPPPPAVAPVLLTGDMERMGDIGLAVRPFRSSDGMSVRYIGLHDGRWWRQGSARDRDGGEWENDEIGATPVASAASRDELSTTGCGVTRCMSDVRVEVEGPWLDYRFDEQAVKAADDVPPSIVSVSALYRT